MLCAGKIKGGYANWFWNDKPRLLRFARKDSGVDELYSPSLAVPLPRGRGTAREGCLTDNLKGCKVRTAVRYTR